MNRIKYWKPLDDDDRICVASFGRKLVEDLEADVDAKLSEERAPRTNCIHLHSPARSLRERSHGTSSITFEPHIGVITDEWNNVVWSDVRAFHGETTALSFFQRFEAIRTETLDAAGPWPALLDTYFELSRFYNAVGFGEMIYLAAQAVEQHPELVSHDYWIIDEYQDFSASEDHLIRLVTENAKGVLLAGDDEQALYQELKASLPDIIISYYQSTDFANTMLPYCSRCSYWICLAASTFIATGRQFDAIGKIYLPLVVDEGAPKVRLVATSDPSSAVAYVKALSMVTRTHSRLYRQDGGWGGDRSIPSDPDATEGAKFLDFKGADDDLRNWDINGPQSQGAVPEISRVSTYYSAHSEASNNFAFRKVLSFEGVSQAAVHPLVETALEQGCRLSEVDSPLVASALEKCDAFAVVVEDDDLTVAEKVGAIRRIDDPAR